MKATLLLLAFISSHIHCDQYNPDVILGKWINIPKKNTIIEVYKTNNEYNGKIVWAKDNDKRKPIGFVILENLEYNPKSQIWENGKIHDPNSGLTYTATAKLGTDSILEVHGYMMFKFLGKTKNFKKIK